MKACSSPTPSTGDGTWGWRRSVTGLLELSQLVEHLRVMKVRSLGLVDEGLPLLGRPVQRIQVVPVALLPSARADDVWEVEDRRSPVRGEAIDLPDALADEEATRQVAQVSDVVMGQQPWRRVVRVVRRRLDVAQVRPGGGQDGGRCLRT